MPDLAWMDLAACVGHPDPDIFFPSRTGKASRQQAQEAARVCAECPVINQCSEHKRRTGATSGVWAGGVHRTKALGRSAASYGGPAQHGTDRRYDQHIRAGEKPCQACWSAHSRANSPNGRSRYRGGMSA